MMLALFFWGTARWWLRVVLVAYALAMALTLVYTGEHYVIDVLVGWLYAGLSVTAVNAFTRSRVAVPAMVQPVLED
jgi:membrane-associated phospholipid phosphatase